MALKKHFKRIVFGLLGGSLAALLLAYWFPQQVLLVDDGFQNADAIVLLGGGSGERPLRAAELFRSNAVPKILVSGAGDADGNRLLLMHRGVPASAISLEPNSKTTRENAQFSIPLLRGSGARRVIIVTTWYHSRRSLKTFRHYAPDLTFYSCPSYYGFPRSEWSHDHLRRRIRAEYLKTMGYWVCYGVCPF
ncbi:MAG TPA: YdcF family protein [Verrucomicrobiae bacterium]|nr:YdcF family protein [Verrucomicrobiae bacterium]